MYLSQVTAILDVLTSSLLLCLRHPTTPHFDVAVAAYCHFSLAPRAFACAASITTAPPFASVLGHRRASYLWQRARVALLPSLLCSLASAEHSPEKPRAMFLRPPPSSRQPH